ncbi:MAG TPA: hypothetical protein VFQ07_00610 [Candidatus Polarisedimenticolia bacterium]|nr:hypothetical protein [Candidatus Polarisedimenticolia bacterium]
MTAARRDLRKLAALLAAAGAAVSLAAAPSPPPPTNFVPAKGEAVYVAAKLKEIRHKSAQPGAPKMTYDMAACEKLVVRKGNAGKRSWTLEDLMGNEVRLQGTWQPWMFRTKDECRNAIARRGEAPVKKAGDVFTVTSAPPAK